MQKIEQKWDYFLKSSKRTHFKSENENPFHPKVMCVLSFCFTENVPSIDYVKENGANLMIMPDYY